MKISELPAKTSANDSDILVIVQNGETVHVNKADFIKQVTTINAQDLTATSLTVTDGTIENVVIGGKRTPTSSTEVIAQGSVFFDDDYMYIAVQDNLIKRIPLEAF